MISADCDLVRDDLDAFADGELRGDDLRRVAQHVEGCRPCAEELDVRQSLGGLIRDTATLYRPAVPRGLASGVVARIRAESAQSWRSVLRRSTEDWHWAIVGGGAVSATFVSALFCVALLIFGTATPAADSISTLGKNLRESPGAIYAEVSRQGATRAEVMLVQLETSAAPSGVYPDVFTRGDEERALVNALAETLAAAGPLQDLSRLSADARSRAQWLLTTIARLRAAEPLVGPFGALQVHRLHLVTNTEVTAKGLTP